MLFKQFVNLRVIEERREIVFFIKKANHFVTHYTNAYHYDGDDIKSLHEYQSICNILRGCSYTTERVCHHHLNAHMTLKSSLVGEKIILVT